MHIPKGDFFSEVNNLVYSDGTLDGSHTLFELSTYNSNIVSEGKFAYIASDVSNGFEPFLYEINMEEGTHRLLKSFQDRSLNLESIHILGVVDNKLYYICNLDTEVGRELYYLPLESSSSVQSLQDYDFDVQFYGESFAVMSNEITVFDVKIYDIDGKLTENMKVRSNTRYDISHLNGTNIFSLISNGKRKSYKYISPK